MCDNALPGQTKAFSLSVKFGISICVTTHCYTLFLCIWIRHVPRKAKSLAFFRFPVLPEVRRSWWISAVRRKSWKPTIVVEQLSMPASKYTPQDSAECTSMQARISCSAIMQWPFVRAFWVVRSISALSHICTEHTGGVHMFNSYLLRIFRKASS